MADPVPYQVTRVWTVMATDTQDAVDKARPGEHHDSVVSPMPCTDWPLPCTHSPQHVRPAGEREARIEQIRRDFAPPQPTPRTRE